MISLALDYAARETTIKDIVTLLVGGVAAFFSIRTYRANAKTRRGEFIYKLHADFFGDAASPYREVRRTLDSTAPEDIERVASYLVDQPESFTDYLNFFEMVAYLKFTGQLEESDVKALFGYYLRSLKSRSFFGTSETRTLKIFHLCCSN